MPDIQGYPPGTDASKVLRIWAEHGIWSDEDSRLIHEEIDLEFGDDRGCGGFSSSEPPCGGCVTCIHGQVSHSIHLNRMEARRYHAAGLEWAPYVIDWWALVTSGGQRAMFHTLSYGDNPRCSCVTGRAY